MGKSVGSLCFICLPIFLIVCATVFLSVYVTVFLSVCLSALPICLSVGGVSPSKPCAGEQQSITVAVVSGGHTGIQGCKGDKLQHVLEERPGLLCYPAPLPP